MATTAPLGTKKNKEREDSLILSIIFHAFLLLLLLLVIYTNANKEDPNPPQFQGIQVMLGNPSLQEKQSQSAPASAAAAQPSKAKSCLLYTSPSPRDQRGSRMPSSA